MSWRVHIPYLSQWRLCPAPSHVSPHTRTDTHRHTQTHIYTHPHTLTDSHIHTLKHTPHVELLKINSHPTENASSFSSWASIVTDEMFGRSMSLYFSYLKNDEYPSSYRSGDLRMTCRKLVRENPLPSIQKELICMSLRCETYFSNFAVRKITRLLIFALIQRQNQGSWWLLPFTDS